jgi:hypothetical protein
LFTAAIEAEQRYSVAYAAMDEAEGAAKHASPKPPNLILHCSSGVFGGKRDAFGRPAVLTRTVIEAYAQPSRWQHMPEEMRGEFIEKARLIVAERLAILDAWETECARQRDLHRVSELQSASEAAELLTMRHGRPWSMRRHSRLLALPSSSLPRCVGMTACRRFGQAAIRATKPSTSCWPHVPMP